MFQHRQLTPRWTAILAPWTLAVCLSASVYAEDCNELLRLGFRNIHTTTSTHDSIASAFRSFCSETYRYASTAAQRQIDAAFKFLQYEIGGSTGFGSNTVEVTQEKFCDLGYTNSQYRDFKSSTAIEIHDRALEAWERCIALNARGLQTDIRPTADLTAVTVDLYWTGVAPAEFRGIDQPDIGKAVCSLTTEASPTAVRVTGNTRVPLTPQTATISCSRQHKVDANGVRSADRLRLTFKTNNGSFDVDMPPLNLHQGNGIDLQAIYEKLAQVQNNINSQIAEVNFQLGSVQQAFNVEIGALKLETTYIFSQGCPPGYTNLGHLGFLKQYGAAPFAQGSDYGWGWTWSHPSLCQRN
ncbi:MAG: hypothetical protein AB7N91_32865 [Candidatus Tectimicrobiota bacterium]